MSGTVYPNVPTAPGVPPLLRQAGAVQSTVVALAADAVSVAGMLQGPQWGLFTAAGAPAFAGATSSNILNAAAGAIGVTNQSVLDLEFSQDYAIATAPQEQGAFLSYNKVSRPFTARVTYAVSGLASFRTAFLQQVQSLISSLTLLSLVMPDYTYPSCNVTHYDFRRTSRSGVTLLIVDIWVEQVRVTGTAAFSNTNTASPSAADPVNGGTVQPQPATAAQTSSLPAGPDLDADGTGAGPTSGAGQAEAPAGTGGDGNSTVGVDTEPMYDANGKQIGVAPIYTPENGPIAGYGANGQPIIGGSWQNGFYSTNGTWITQSSAGGS
jgi:hypothetical protein